MNFRNRGARIEEQIDVLRAFWRHELADYDGEWHRIEDAGINPLPVQRPIPIWLGGGADTVLRRIARQADGWIAPTLPMPEFETKLRTLRGYLDDEGRNADEFPVHTRLKLTELDREDWTDRVAAVRDLGVTHLAVGTMNLDLAIADDHLELLADFRTDLRGAGLR